MNKSIKGMNKNKKRASTKIYAIFKKGFQISYGNIRKIVFMHVEKHDDRFKDLK